MVNKLSDILLTTDIDGTLLNTPAPIPPRNLAAIARFTEKGGRFAIATGRAVESARQFADQLPINTPCIVFNGCGVYDYHSEKLLYARYLSESYRTHLKKIVDHFPHIGAIMVSEKTLYSVGARPPVEKFLGMEGEPFTDGKLDALDGSFFKTIMAMEEESIPLVEAYANAQGWKDVTFVRSSPFYLEMLPLGSDKGSGLIALAELEGISIENTVSIGDYYNDLEMLKTTGFPVTVAEAPDDIKQICKLVTGPCDNGALADLIEYLEEKYPMA